MLRVGLIGAGFIGMQHIEAIGRIQGAKIVAISDTNLDMLKELKEKGVCENIYTDYIKMLEEEKLDVLHNCTPTNLHFSINKLALEKGINVYSEKPLVKETFEGDQLLEILKDKKLVTGVNFNYRNNLLVQEMHYRVKSDDFGKILLVQGEYLQDWLMFDTDYDWRLDIEVGGKSRALADIGSHLFDTLEYVTSKRIKSVNAKLFITHKQRKKFNDVGTFKQVTSFDDDYEIVDVENEDGGLIQLELEGGVLASLVVSQVSAGKKNGLKINVSGEKYALEWEQEQSDRLWIGHRDKGNEEIYADAKYVSEEVRDYATLPNGHPVGWHDALTNGIRAFYSSINEGNYSETQTFATFRDANHILKVIDACFESNKLGKWVEVKD